MKHSTRFAVLIPDAITEDEQDIYGEVIINKQKFYIIDEVSYTGTAEDCRDGLINHDGYSPYIVCVSCEYLPD